MRRGILRVLSDHDVDFVLVGGAAAIAHGATRATRDVDVVAARTDTNFERLTGALRDLNARLRIEGLSDAESQALPSVVHPDMFRRAGISTWRTDAGSLDVLSGLESEATGESDFESLVKRASIGTIGGVSIAVASLDDVIAAKTKANRAKDRAALPELRDLRDRRDLDEG